jgi:hypothetical protein
MSEHNDYQFAELNQQQLKKLLDVEDSINSENSDPVYIIAYRKK